MFGPNEQRSTPRPSLLSVPPSLSASPTHHLHIGDGDVEVLREIGVPDKANVGQEHAPQVALVRREVPYALDLFRHFEEAAQQRRHSKDGTAKRHKQPGMRYGYDIHRKSAAAVNHVVLPRIYRASVFKC